MKATIKSAAAIMAVFANAILASAASQARAAAPEIEWQRALGGTGGDSAYSVQQTSDGVM